MCCSAWPARFSQTITGTWEVAIEGVINHVLWYQNRVGRGSVGGQIFEVIVRQALAGAPWQEICAGPMQVNQITERDVILEVNRRLKAMGQQPWKVPGAELSVDEGNCLIIPLLGAWRSIRLLNTAANSELLLDVSHAVRNQPLRSPVAVSNQAGSYGASGSAVVFMKFDIYDIVLAESALDIPAALLQIVPEKRPRVNGAVFKTFSDWYDCPVAVCCFNNAESGESKPIAFAFEPMYPEKLVVYTLDGHDGEAPSPTKTVSLDHAVFVGSYLTNPRAAAWVDYKQEIPYHLRPYMLDRVMGMHISSKLENGDIVFGTESVRAGQFEGLRMLPPKAPRDVPRLGQLVTRTESYVLGPRLN